MSDLTESVPLMVGKGPKVVGDVRRVCPTSYYTSATGDASTDFDEVTCAELTRRASTMVPEGEIG